MKKLIEILFLLTLLVVNSFCDSDEEYIDPVIDMLLNGVSGESNSNEEPAVTGGIWKCGNCTNTGDAMLVHSETNLVDADEDVHDADVQISLEISGMRCVTVTSELPGAVRQLVGSCDGASVTLSVSPSHNFTVFVYT